MASGLSPEWFQTQSGWQWRLTKLLNDFKRTYISLKHFKLFSKYARSKVTHAFQCSAVESIDYIHLVSLSCKYSGNISSVKVVGHYSLILISLFYVNIPIRNAYKTRFIYYIQCHHFTMSKNSKWEKCQTIVGYFEEIIAQQHCECQ